MKNIKNKNLTNVLLLLILITLLGAWSIIGITALVIIGVLIALWIVYILISSLTDVESWKETWSYIKPGLIATVVITALLFVLLYRPNEDELPTQPNGFTFEELQQRGARPVYQYVLENTTNVRGCGSFDCAVIGQYPADTEFKFSSDLADLPKWINISWISDTGETQYGYIHKSTLRLTAFEILKRKAELEKQF